MKQNDFMTFLHFLSEDDAFTIEAYANAESRGIIDRKSNLYDLSPKEYARRLLTDGKDKGWLERKKNKLRTVIPDKSI